MRPVALLVSCSLVIGTSVRPAAADDLVKGIIGLGGAILLNEAIKNERRRQEQPPYRYAPSRPQAVSEETRIARAEIQRRLNALGYDAGRPDGVFGPRTRRAIAQFQASLGEVGDGKISPTQIERLYAMSGGGFPAGSSGGFPAAESGDAFASNGNDAPSFPALGGGGSNTGSDGGPAFPKLGGDAASGDGAGEPAFPKLGGSDDSGGQTAAFPALGAGPQGEGGAAAFPQLGAAPDKTTESMPKLGGTGGEPKDAESFPQMAATPQAETPSAFPSVASPPPGGGMPPILGVGPKSDADGPKAEPGVLASLNAAEMTLELESAKTPYKSTSALPAILELKLGMSNQFVADRLSKEGYSSCAAEGSITTCKRATDTLDDIVRIGADPEGRIWLIDRHVSFRAPVEAAFLAGQMTTAYPEIMASPTRMIGSNEGCANGDGLTTADNATIAGISVEDEADPSRLAVMASCPVGFLIDFGTEARTQHLKLRFHDATPFLRLHLENAERSRQVQQEALTNDLKL